MNPHFMTLERLASISVIHDLVGKKPDRRWGRASLVGRRSDGHSIATYFATHSAAERVQLVREAILDALPWSDLLRVLIPKSSGIETRAVDMPIVLDQGRLYSIADWLSDYAETVLSPVAVAFRRGRRLHQTVLGAYQDALRKPFACVIDIKGFYDNVTWQLADEAIERLPADEGVRRLLKDLVRAPAIHRGTGERISRTMGLVQGLSPSPVLANLILNDWDRQVAHAVSRFGVSLRRYCDDILLLAASRSSLLRAIGIVTDRLARLSLAVRQGTGRTADIRQEAMTWLGISLGPAGLDVPQHVLATKIREIQGEIDQGFLGPQGLEDSLIGLVRHYERIVPQDRAQESITTIRSNLTLPNHDQEEEETRALRHIFRDHPSHGLKHREMSALDDELGSKKMNPPGPGEGWPGYDSGTLRRSDVKPRASSTGAPAQSAPAAAEKGTAWRIGIRVNGPRQAHVIARRVGDRWHDGWAFVERESLSVHEVVVLALANGLVRLRDRGATEVTVVVTDTTLYGYRWRGWGVHSLRMHAALRRLGAARAGMRLVFEPGRRFRHAPSGVPAGPLS